MTRTRFGRVLMAAVAATLGVSPGAGAQQTIAPELLFRGIVERDAPWLALLREAHAQGSQEKMVLVVTEFLADLSRAQEVTGELARGKVPGACCDQGRHVFQVAFLASEAAGAPLVRMFVHKDGLGGGALPGIRGPEQPLFEVFVAEDLTVRLRSVYQSDALEDPLAEESGDFVRLILGKLALPIGASTIASRVTAAMGEEIRSPQQQEMRLTKPPLAVTLTRIALPVRRARITISHTVSVTDPAAHIRAQAGWLADTALRHAVVAAAIGETPTGAAELDSEFLFPQTAYAACSAMARRLADDAIRTTEAAACSPLKVDPAKCFAAVRDAIGESYESAVSQPGSCPADAAYPLVGRFVSVVPARVVPIKGSTVVSNAPRTRWSFGLSTAFIASIQTDNARPRTKISSGRIVVDPFSRVLAMGTVSFIPAGYDPGSIGLRAKERFRLFAGVAFAPHFGATGGAAWSFNQYLGANVGYALLVYDTPKPGESLDTAPSAANRAAPFDLARTHALFVGFTFNLK